MASVLEDFGSLYSLFVREAAHGKVLTIGNLRKGGFCLIDWCYLCKSDGESVDHVLLHCSVARGLWSYVLCMLNSWVMPRRVVDVLRCWKRKFDNPIALAV